MLPGLTMHDVMDGLYVHGVILRNRGQGFPGSVPFTDSQHIRGNQFSSMNFLSHHCGIVPMLVYRVVLATIPAQIINSIISSIPVVVARLQTIGARANKCQEDKPMDRELPGAIFIADTHIGITRFWVRWGFFAHQKVPCTIFVRQSGARPVVCWCSTAPAID